MPPPTSASAPTAPDPVSDFYTSKTQAGALLVSAPVVYFDMIAMKLRAATINTVTPTQLKLNVASAPGGTVTFDLTGDGTANIPVATVTP